MAKCPECFGNGSVTLFTSDDECPDCGGSGSVPDPDPDPVEPETVQEEGNIVVGVDRGVDLGTGSSITIVGGDYSTGGTGGDFVLTAGDATSTGGTLTLTNSNIAPTMTICGNGSSASLVSGTGHPKDEPSYAEPGSLYFRNDDGAGRLYVKTGPEPQDWAELATASGEDEEDDLPPAQVDKILPWTIRKLEQLEPDDEGSYPEWLCNYPIPAIAPICEALLADAMALVEQEGHEVHAFVTSCRDFADVRKIPDSKKIRWEDDRVWLFGVEVLRSKDVPQGTFCAVSRDGYMSVCCITR